MPKSGIIRNNLSYHQFRKELIRFKVFSLIDVKKVFSDFDSKRLVEWQQKGYIKKLINKWYLFSEVPVSEDLLFRISNCLHNPSYISLESALLYYHLIPEQVYTVQAISTRKTILYQTATGNFKYRAIKAPFYFGYQVLHSEGLPILMADLEKAILDYFYLNARIKTIEDIRGLRWNIEELKNLLDFKKLDRYAAVFNSPTLNKKIMMLKKIF